MTALVLELAGYGFLGPWLVVAIRERRGRQPAWRWTWLLLAATFACWTASYGVRGSWWWVALNGTALVTLVLARCHQRTRPESPSHGR